MLCARCVLYSEVRPVPCCVKKVSVFKSMNSTFANRP